MKKSLVIFGLLCLCLSVTAFRCSSGSGGGGHQGEDGHWECDDEFSSHCWWVPHHRFLIEPQFQQSTVDDLSDFVGVVDLSQAWQYDSSQKKYVVVTLRNATGKTMVKSFTLAEASSSVAASIPSLNDNTVPYVFVLANPTALQDFISEGLADGFQDLEASPRIPVMQVDFTVPSGNYINHLRVKDSQGLFYDDPFTIEYEAPAIQNGSTPGTVNIVN